VTTNLVSLVMRILAPGVIGRTADACGSKRNEIQFAISNAVPALLVAFNNVAVVGGSVALFASILQQSGKTSGQAAFSGEE
jgi:hypothetical protein